MKIEIEVIKHDDGQTDYKVTDSDKFADRLTFDEMLGLVASLTMPESRRCIQWMRTLDEWKRREDALQELAKFGSKTL
ncbi:hypothetical protein KC887_07085 [Candidatus Kaiserbacteria bacterium]|nr:hypothetical protein [Candidatus Kaiserbacteria bacterium]